MAIRVICSQCKADFKLADDKRGKKIRCPKCGEVFLAQPMKAGTVVATQKAKPSRPAKERVAEIDDEAEVDDEVEIDEEERPARPSKNRARDVDQEDRPAKGKKSFRPKKTINVNLIVGMCLGTCILVACLVGGWFAYQKLTKGGNEVEDAWKSLILITQDASVALEKAKDEDSSKDVAEKLDAICNRLDALAKRMDSMSSPSAQEDARLKQKYESELTAIAVKLDTNFQKSQAATNSEPTLRIAFERFKRGREKFMASKAAGGKA